MKPWYLQIHDENGNVLVQNQYVGMYIRYTKWVEKAVNKIVSNYPNAKRWQCSTIPYYEKAIL